MENNKSSGAFVEEEIDLSRYWRVISRRKWSIISLAVMVSLLAMFIVYSMTPYYKATSTLLIQPQQAKLPSIEDLYGLAGKDKEYYLTQLEMLKSRVLAEKVIAELNLLQKPEFMPKEGGFHPVAYIKQWLGLTLDTEIEAEPIDAVVAAFKERLAVSLIKDTQLISISFVSETPALAASVANALGDVYINDQLSSRIDMTRRATSWMEQRLTVLKSSLDASEQLLQRYKEDNELVDIKGVSSLTAQELDELTTRLLLARSKFSEISKRYGVKHPRYIASRSEVTAAERELARSKGHIQRIGRKEVKLRELQRQVESNRQIYDTFLARLKEANQAVDLKTSNARIFDPAVAPAIPFKPKKGLVVALAFFASLMLGVLLAFFFEALDKTFKNSTDIEDELGLPMLGLLPLIRSHRKDRQSHAFAMLDPKETAYAEAMRTIRTGLVLSSLDNPHKVVLVTSSIPGEGKTTVSTNLAAAMGKMERVLLIGADLRRPSLSNAIGLDKELPGLTNLVAGTSELSDCIHHLDHANIDVLPCGQLPPNPQELLSSERFHLVIAMLEKNYDRIVIDSPPLHAVSDSLVLSRFAKAVVFVVEADATHEQLVKNAVKRLLQHGAPIAGIILNKFDVKKSLKYGEEYGGYYDHYGYSDQP